MARSDMLVSLAICAVGLVPVAECLQTNALPDENAHREDVPVICCPEDPYDEAEASDSRLRRSIREGEPGKFHVGVGGNMFEGENRIDWPYRDFQRDVDAWVWMMHMYEDNPLFDSLLLSLGDGLHTAGYNVGLVMQGTNTMLGNISKAVENGRKPLVVGIAYPWTTKKSIFAWTKAKKLGAFMVLYQTEPLELAELPKYNGLYFPDEIWDYAHANIQMYPGPMKQKYRYMPPGYVKQLDFGVARLPKPKGVDSVGFMGNWHSRSKEFHEKMIDAFHGNLVNSKIIYSADEYREWMTAQPIQLTLHKREQCNNCPVEAFRLAQLLANGVCVISAPAYKEDEKEFDGIVTFANISDMNERFEDLAKNLDTCNEKASTFRKRFDPHAIFERAGTAWKP